MTWTVFYYCLFSFWPLFSGQLDIVSKDALDILIDNDMYTFATDTCKVRVSSYNVDKKMRELSDEKLVALLNSGSHYIDVVKCSDNDYVAYLQGRLNGGGAILGEVFYYGTKAIAYGVITAGVIGSIVRSRRAARDAERITDIAREVANHLPNGIAFEPMPLAPTMIPAGMINHGIEGGVGVVVGLAGLDPNSGAVVVNGASGACAIGAGAVANVVANNPTLDHIAQNGVWEFMANVPPVAASTDLVRAAQAIGVHNLPGAAPGTARAGFGRTLWQGVCRRVGEIGAIIEVAAQVARRAGQAIPGPV